MLSHGNHVWATSTQADHKGSLLKFDDNKKEGYINVPVKCEVTKGDNSLPDGNYGISLACSDNHVYVGTISGWCLMFPTDVSYHTVPILGVKLSCHYIRSLVVVKKTSLLWVSAGDQIYFLLIVPTLNFSDEDKKGHNVDWRVGTLLLSPDEEIMWTVHINGHSISAWKAQNRELICPFNSHHLLDKNID